MTSRPTTTTLCPYHYYQINGCHPNLHSSVDSGTPFFINIPPGMKTNQPTQNIPPHTPQSRLPLFGTSAIQSTASFQGGFPFATGGGGIDTCNIVPSTTITTSTANTIGGMNSTIIVERAQEQQCYIPWTHPIVDEIDFTPSQLPSSPSQPTRPNSNLNQPPSPLLTFPHFQSNPISDTIHTSKSTPTDTTILVQNSGTTPVQVLQIHNQHALYMRTIKHQIPLRCYSEHFWEQPDNKDFIHFNRVHIPFLFSAHICETAAATHSNSIQALKELPPPPPGILTVEQFRQQLQQLITFKQLQSKAYNDLLSTSSVSSLENGISMGDVIPIGPAGTTTRANNNNNYNNNDHNNNSKTASTKAQLIPPTICPHLVPIDMNFHQSLNCLCRKADCPLCFGWALGPSSLHYNSDKIKKLKFQHQNSLLNAYRPRAIPRASHLNEYDGCLYCHNVVLPRLRYPIFSVYFTHILNNYYKPTLVSTFNRAKRAIQAINNSVVDRGRAQMDDPKPCSTKDNGLTAHSLDDIDVDSSSPTPYESNSVHYEENIQYISYPRNELTISQQVKQQCLKYLLFVKTNPEIAKYPMLHYSFWANYTQDLYDAANRQDNINPYDNTGSKQFNTFGELEDYLWLQHNHSNTIPNNYQDNNSSLKITSPPQQDVSQVAIQCGITALEVLDLATKFVTRVQRLQHFETLPLSTLFSSSYSADVQARWGWEEIGWQQEIIGEEEVLEDSVPHSPTKPTESTMTTKLRTVDDVSDALDALFNYQPPPPPQPASPVRKKNTPTKLKPPPFLPPPHPLAVPTPSTHPHLLDRLLTTQRKPYQQFQHLKSLLPNFNTLSNSTSINAQQFYPLQDILLEPLPQIDITKSLALPLFTLKNEDEYPRKMSSKLIDEDGSERSQVNTAPTQWTRLLSKLKDYYNPRPQTEHQSCSKHLTKPTPKTESTILDTLQYGISCYRKWSLRPDANTTHISNQGYHCTTPISQFNPLFANLMNEQGTPANSNIYNSSTINSTDMNQPGVLAPAANDCTHLSQSTVHRNTYTAPLQSYKPFNPSESIQDKRDENDQHSYNNPLAKNHQQNILNWNSTWDDSHHHLSSPPGVQKSIQPNHHQSSPISVPSNRQSHPNSVPHHHHHHHHHQQQEDEQQQQQQRKHQPSLPQELHQEQYHYPTTNSFSTPADLRKRLVSHSYSGPFNLTRVREDDTYTNQVKQLTFPSLSSSLLTLINTPQARDRLLESRHRFVQMHQYLKDNPISIRVVKVTVDDDGFEKSTKDWDLDQVSLETSIRVDYAPSIKITPLGQPTAQTPNKKNLHRLLEMLPLTPPLFRQLSIYDHYIFPMLLLTIPDDHPSQQHYNQYLTNQSMLFTRVLTKMRQIHSATSSNLSQPVYITTIERAFNYTYPPRVTVHTSIHSQANLSTNTLLSHLTTLPPTFSTSANFYPLTITLDSILKPPAVPFIKPLVPLNGLKYIFGPLFDSELLVHFFQTTFLDKLNYPDLYKLRLRHAERFQEKQFETAMGIDDTLYKMTQLDYYLTNPILLSFFLYITPLQHQYHPRLALSSAYTSVYMESIRAVPKLEKTVVEKVFPLSTSQMLLTYIYIKLIKQQLDIEDSRYFRAKPRVLVQSSTMADGWGDLDNSRSIPKTSSTNLSPPPVSGSLRSTPASPPLPTSISLTKQQTSLPIPRLPAPPPGPPDIVAPPIVKPRREIRIDSSLVDNHYTIPKPLAVSSSSSQNATGVGSAVSIPNPQPSAKSSLPLIPPSSAIRFTATSTKPLPASTLMTKLGSTSSGFPGHKQTTFTTAGGKVTTQNQVLLDKLAKLEEEEEERKKAQKGAVGVSASNNLNNTNIRDRSGTRSSLPIASTTTTTAATTRTTTLTTTSTATKGIDANINDKRQAMLTGRTVDGRMIQLTPAQVLQEKLDRLQQEKDEKEQLEKREQQHRQLELQKHQKSVNPMGIAFFESATHRLLGNNTTPMQQRQQMPGASSSNRASVGRQPVDRNLTPAQALQQKLARLKKEEEEQITQSKLDLIKQQQARNKKR